MKRQVSSSQFCLYLWRSIESPGVRYLAKCADAARAVYSEMEAEGYIVKAVEVPTGREFEVRNGDFVPVHARPNHPGCPALA